MFLRRLLLLLLEPYTVKKNEGGMIEREPRYTTCVTVALSPNSPRFFAEGKNVNNLVFTPG